VAEQAPRRLPRVVAYVLRYMLAQVMQPLSEATLSELQSLPASGSAVLGAVLVAAAYTFAVSVAAAGGRPRLLRSARLGAYGTSALVLLAVLLLAHDFRIRYVARYSDRSMPTVYLLTALWGGQDGSLLWWLLLQTAFVAAAIRWLKGRYRELQPYVIATLMMVVGFFALLMLFAADPFETYAAGARPDGMGLNPLLQNHWMILHPPALYVGFVGCAVPFAFAVAALVSGRLDNEWIAASRKWMLFAWLFLSVGNALGMLWAYEELGWGGYWAWDPVENTGLLPWLAASAYVHSTVIQERRNMLRVWNVILICLTFLLTIFGTFLTRSGLISSVHSFARSDIGIFFLWYMGVVVGGCAALIVWRWPRLRQPTRVESLASREATFVVNNWALLLWLALVMVATSLPLVTEWWQGNRVAVGPPFFNRWAKPFGLLLFALMGLCPLFGWGKTSTASLRKSLPVPLAALLAGAVLHLAVGNAVGLPAIVEEEAAFSGPVGLVVQQLDAAVPLITMSLVFFNLAVIAQEVARGVVARQRTARRREERENPLLALARLVARNRRRYGGYVVHLGIVFMYVGFVGRAWVITHDSSLAPGEHHRIGRYELVYLGPRICPGSPDCTQQQVVDRSKQMLFADLQVRANGRVAGVVSPAKFVYRRMPERPTSEVGLLRSLRDDLYAVAGEIGTDTRRSTFRLYVNPLVSWIWIGLLVLIAGACVSLWPQVSRGPLGAWEHVRPGAGSEQEPA
jgi:cytochrome c-type biogenesis protein CcmF